MTEESVQLKGLALPAVRDRQGYFESKTGVEVAWGDLLLALLTPIGSRPMNRAFGSTLHQLLLTPIQVSAQKVRYLINEAAAKWCPHVIIRGIAVEPKGRELAVSIAFSLRGSAEVATRALPLSLSGLANAASQNRLGA